jgi:chromate transporter
VPSLLIALTTIGVLFKFKKLQEPYIIIVAAVIGLALKAFVLN